MTTMKKLFSLIIASLLIISLVACKKNTSTTKKGTTTVTTKKVIEEVEDYVLPSLSDKETVAFSNEELKVSVTKDQIYKMIKHHNGIDVLVEMIDKYLLADEIAKVADNDAQAKINDVIYGGKTAEEIALLSDDEKTKLEAEAENNFKVLGLDTDEEKLAYAKLVAARENYAREYIKNNKDDEKALFYIDDAALENFYKTEGNENTVNAVVVIFNSGDEYINTLKDLGYVVYNSKLATCTESPVNYNNLNDENCTVLEASDAKAVIASLYEKVYGEAAPSDGTSYTFEDASKVSQAFANKLFEVENDNYFYLPKAYSVKYGTAYILVYRVSGEAQTEYKDLEDAQKEELLDAYIESLLTAANIGKVMAQLRTENEIEFYDKFYGMDYASAYDMAYNYTLTKGDSTNLVKLTDKTFTCADLYDYACGINKETYVYYAAIKDIAKTYESYNLIYSEKSDVRYQAFKEEIQKDIDDNFQTSSYTTTNEYLYNKYGFSNIDDVVEYVKVYQDATRLALLDILFDEVEIEPAVDGEEPKPAVTEIQVLADYQNKFNEVLNDLYDNYYNVKAWQLVVYADKDLDFEADDMKALAESDTQVQAQLTALYEKVNSYIASCKNTDQIIEKLAEFIEEYNASSLDGGEYAAMKNAGLKVKYSVISSSAISYSSRRDTYSKELNAGLLALYQAVKADDFDGAYYVLPELVLDVEGAHFIFGKEGSTSAKPSFKYVNVSSSVNKLSKNDVDKISLAQLTGAYYVYNFKQLFTNAATASDTYQVTIYPLSMASSLDFSSYTTLLEKYFMSEDFIGSIFANKLGTDYAKLVEVFNYNLTK